MISVEKAKQVFDEVLSKTDMPAQCLISGGKNQMARIGQNHVYHNLLNKDYSLKILVDQAGKMGSASSNRFNGPEIEQMVKRAEAVAQHSKVDPDWSGFYADDKQVDDRKHYVDDAMELPFEEKLKELGPIFEDARRRNIQIAGAFSHGDEIMAIANKKGLFRYHIATDSSFTFSIMTTKGGTGWSEFHARDVREIQPGILYDIALEKALGSENPRELEAGEYTVIMEPPAVQAFMLFLGYMGLAGLSYREGRSFFSGKDGEKLFGDNITVVDDWSDEQSFGSPFDYEGCARQTVEMIKNGVFKTPVFDRMNAEKCGKASTGHALPYPTSYGPLPLNMRLLGGDSSLEEMIRTTKKGVLITRTFYDNILDPSKLSMTGMTRDGTFLVEDGKVVCGLKNLRYNDSIPRILNNVVQLSNQTWSLREFGRLSLPAMKVEGFKFTGSST
jgi:predicted Zn-dependent protease